MSDTARLTNPKLKICGGLGIDTADVSTDGSWFDGLLDLLLCKRSKEWRTNDATIPADTKPQDILPISSTRVKKLSGVNFSWTTNIAADNFKILLAFPRDDQQSEIIANVARKLGWSVSEARNAEKAAELFSSGFHDLVIVDRRGAARSEEADEICRSIIENSTKRHFIVALVKKSFFTAPSSDEQAVLQLLNIGYNRALMECSHEGILMNELIGIFASESQPKGQLVAAQLLYTAVDKCRDIVHVTNDEHVVQVGPMPMLAIGGLRFSFMEFANRASEKMLGYKSDELLGKPIAEFVTMENFKLINQQLRKGREFEGSVSWKRKTKGVLGINCRIVPVHFPLSDNAYYVYMYDATSAFETTSSTNFQQQPRDSVHSLGRRSFEIRPTNKPRRSTLKKLNDLPFDVPITKVITLLTSAMQDSTNYEVTSQIKTAIEMISSEMFTPQLKDGGVIDPTASDLLKALISDPSNDPRKSSTSLGRQSQILKILNLNQQQANAKLLKSPPRLPRELDDLLAECFEWSFDIFKLEVLSDRRPLYYLGITVMEHYRVAERLEIEEKILHNWLMIIESNYNGNVSYHNSTHATDVLQAIARFMRSERLQMIVDPLDEVAALLAAAAHDIGHPGKSSQFLCNAKHKLALLYNDITVLESHHAALCFKLTLADDNVNIFKNLNRDVYKSLRQNVIDMILATEMSKHFEHLTKFVSICNSKVDALADDYAENVIDTAAFQHPENVILTKRMMIKCADVSNPTRPLKLYVEWARRIAEEYFNQTDEEKKRKLPVVMPMFDRASCSIPRSQIGFVEYIINDMMEAWDAFIDMPEMIGNMKVNYEKWKEFNEKGIMTIQDIEKLQETPELQLYKKPSKSK